MTTFFSINPGSGPVVHATEENAWVNIRAFVTDLSEKGVGIVNILRRSDRDDLDGRYEYDLFLKDPEPREDSEPRTRIGIAMPGLPLERVRYLGGTDQNILDFPRLYVDGSSWVWKFAIGVCVPDVRL